jgi:anti-sigma-K factor RskA
MSEDDTIDPADGGKLIAAEYVLGVLGAEERREVERRLAQEPALASEVAFWEERLTGLADAVAPVSPPQATWSRIETAIGVAPRLPSVWQSLAFWRSFGIASETAIGVAPRPPSVWQSLAFWRSFGIASATLAAASIAALAYIGLVPSTRAPLMATLGGSAGQPNFVAAVTASGNSLVIVPAALLTNDPRAFELWLIPAGETRPRSLGLIQPGQPIRLEIPSDLAGRVTPDATLAVSLEPPGGSPTGLPTGPVIAAGKLTNL